MYRAVERGDHATLRRNRFTAAARVRQSRIGRHEAELPDHPHRRSRLRRRLDLRRVRRAHAEHRPHRAPRGCCFTAMRANCTVCSPSRAALLTGRYPDRVGVPGVIRTEPADSWGYFDPAVPTLADELKTGRLSHRDRRQVASRPRVAQHAQRARLRFLPRLSRRHDGQLHHASAPGPELHAPQRGGHRPRRARDRSVHRLGRASICGSGPGGPISRSSSTWPTTRRISRSSRRPSGWRGSSSARRTWTKSGPGTSRSSSISTTASAACWRRSRERAWTGTPSSSSRPTTAVRCRTRRTTIRGAAASRATTTAACACRS